MAVDGINKSSNDLPLVPREKTGFAGLDSEDFLKLLITQLQNQDPTEPIGNEELLNQLSQMRNIQASIELETAMKSITSNQQLSTAATFIGKSVTGTNASEQQVTGVADRAFLREGVAYVGIGAEDVPLSSVTSVTANAA
jgi:flagellar basal-body rod modification protein FlgD